ncbi:RimJ/RimL family protein N-acetyltransferase [Rhodoglobus vestalii]|uniref:RimJ/RimL family protein N-acetyltransferase n=1 Tax=Rhodoglobus vestalii TaxID=193384 RepID=A0A8H2K5V2_9MICO|nr:GNAT family N-acetyltransferase [Rhodoglobus vestalii]TQO19469.1 RimJ/RimL family protein N-acetyltransferase [Rhodoglobus vestalii]
MRSSLRPRFLRGSSLKHTVQAPTLHTERLVLRPHRIADAARWYEIQSSPDVLAYTSWPERDAAQSRIHLKERTRHVVLKQANDFLALAIEHDGQLIGDVGLHLRSIVSTSRTAEISWILHPEHYGHGFAAEATSAMMNFAFEQVQIQFLVAVIEAPNAASIVLAERLGFQKMAHDGDSLGFVAGNIR